MNTLQLLLVEDDDHCVDDYKAVLEDYIDRYGRQLRMRVVGSLDDAKQCLRGSIGAAIVDLNLGGGTSDGGEIIATLKKSFRVPVAVLTGTPADAEKVPPVVGVFTKGQDGFDDVLDLLWKIHQIGLTKIMGGQGLLEKHLNQVFLRNLLPTLDVWIGYGAQNRKRTERALLRFALGHLVAGLEGDETPCYPEEVYLDPPLEHSLQTGSLVRRKERLAVQVVMTPACDLVIRSGGKPKTDVVVIAEVVPEANVFAVLDANGRLRKKLRRNNYSSYFHWLPTCQEVEGGFVDFRRLETVDWCELSGKFHRLKARVAPSFVKDMVSRFSTFYARQGQPDIVVPAD